MFGADLSDVTSCWVNANPSEVKGHLSGPQTNQQEQLISS